MGIYKRKDSPYWWLCLEQPGMKSLREPTKVPIAGGAQAARVAEQHYQARMVDLARERALPRRLRQTTKVPAGWSYLYFISDGQHVKVGRAISVLNRLRALQVSHAKPLTVIAAVPSNHAVERDVHRAFRDFREKGEWFRHEGAFGTFLSRVVAGEHPAAILANLNHATSTAAHNATK